jgi:hypothetical protein
MSKMEADHEFPWVEVDMETRVMHCSVCKVNGSTDNWLGFLSAHQDCASIWDYPRTLPADEPLFKRRERGYN